MKSIKDIWEEIEQWYNKNYNVSLNLRPRASQAMIQKAEEKMKIQFPEDFKAHLLLHDGQEQEATVPGLIGNGLILASLERIIEQWQSQRTMAMDVENEKEILDFYQKEIFFYHPQFIPIAGNYFWDGDNAYLNLVAYTQEKKGQIIALTSECDFSVIGNSFHHALERYLDILQSGKIYWSKESEDLQVKDDARKNLSYAFGLQK